MAINRIGFYGTFVFVPVVDAKFITDRPTQLLKQRRVNGVRLQIIPSWSQLTVWVGGFILSHEQLWGYSIRKSDDVRYGDIELHYQPIPGAFNQGCCSRDCHLLKSRGLEHHSCRHYYGWMYDHLLSALLPVLTERWQQFSFAQPIGCCEPLEQNHSRLVPILTSCFLFASNAAGAEWICSSTSSTRGWFGILFQQRCST